jgi:biopolymer transport protein ExbB
MSETRQPKPVARGEQPAASAGVPPRKLATAHALTRRLKLRPRKLAGMLLVLFGIACGGATNTFAADGIATEATEEGVDTSELHVPTKSLWDMVMAGGPTMVPLAGCSVVLLIFIFERAVSLRRARIAPRPFIKRFLHQVREGQLDRDGALALCEENGTPVARVFAVAAKKWGRSSVEMEQAVMDAGERIVTGLRRYLRVLSGLHTVTPLIGLFGTVMGIITSFNALATSEALGKAEMLAQGISEALLATAAGLTVAIPALIAYLYFVGKVDQLTVELDAAGQELISIISAEAIQEAKGLRLKKAA